MSGQLGDLSEKQQERLERVSELYNAHTNLSHSLHTTLSTELTHAQLAQQGHYIIVQNLFLAAATFGHASVV